MRKLYLAPLALLAYCTVPAALPAQSVTGCSSVPANRIATSRDAKALQADIDCAGVAAAKIVTPRKARLAALATPAPAPSPTPTPTPVAWRDCAIEGGVCTIDTGRVRYGFGSKWVERQVTGSIACDNLTFGDPAPNVGKVCQTTGTVQAAPAPTPSPTPTATPAPAPSPTPAPAPIPTDGAWVQGATEGGQLLITYDTNVRMRRDGQPDSNAVVRVGRAGFINCGLSPFWGSDPAPGYGKACDYQVRTGLDKPLANAAGFTLGVNVAPPSYYSGEPSLANLMTGEAWRDLTGWDSRRATVVDADDNLNLQPSDRALKVLTMPAPAWGGKDTSVVCTWTGKAEIDIGGSGLVRYGANRLTFTYAGANPVGAHHSVWMNVNKSDPADPLRNLDCRDASLARDVVYEPSVVASLKPFRVLRFLDWSGANGNPAVVTWATRTQPGSLNQAQGPTGAAIETMVGLANAAGAEPWLNVPWNADEDYQRRMAQLVHDTVPPGRKVWVELSNEVWNWMFGVTHQAAKEGTERGLSTVAHEAAQLRYAEKVRWMMAIWSKVYADRPQDLVRVGAIQTGGGSAELTLGAGKMADSVDVVAIAPYIGGDLMQRMSGASADVILAELGKEADAMPARLDEVKNVLRRYGKRMVAYEAGQHLTGQPVATIVAANRAPEMEAIYDRYFAAWRASANDTMVLFNSTSPITQFGAWGLQEYTGQPLSDTPKRRAALKAAK